MKKKTIPANSMSSWRSPAVALMPGGAICLQGHSAIGPAENAVKIPADQLDALVAPIALFPDHCWPRRWRLRLIRWSSFSLSNGSTKTLRSQRTRKTNRDDEKQPWDPSIQAMAPLSDLVKRLADDIQWTTDLGNAFLAQQTDVMDAIQRMRAKAKEKGALASNEQQVVENKTVEGKQVIVIEQANPEVVYVPSYNPAYVRGAGLPLSGYLVSAIDRSCLGAARFRSASAWRSAPHGAAGLGLGWAGAAATSTST